MTNNQLTDQKLTKIIESAEAVISALAGTNDDVHPDNSTKMCRLWDALNDDDAPPEVVLVMAKELQELRHSYLALRGEIEDVQSQLYEAEKQANEYAAELQEHRKPLQDKDLQGVIGALEHPAGINAAGKKVVRSALAELQERRKAGEPELNPANLANKFYERYPLATFKSDSERAEAFGYFMAGAELQCFGEFIKYEDLCGDE